MIWLAIGLALSIVVFWQSWTLGWHWGVGIVVSTIPLAFTFFLGMWGVVIAAVFTAALFNVPR